MINHPPSTGSPAFTHRRTDTEMLFLAQIDPPKVVDGVAVKNGYLSDDIIVGGEMRETCPVCKTVHLKIVLRQENVKRAHLFCEQCTRCFNASYHDGSPVNLIA